MQALSSILTRNKTGQRYLLFQTLNMLMEKNEVIAIFSFKAKYLDFALTVL